MSATAGVSPTGSAPTAAPAAPPASPAAPPAEERHSGAPGAALHGEPEGSTWVRAAGAVDSIQWVDLAPPALALDLAALERAYFAWVPAMAAGLVAPAPGAAGTDRPLTIGPVPWTWPPAIRLAAPALAPGRRARAVLGGLLAFAGGELAFELAPTASGGTRLRVALVGFRPRAPMPVYLVTQRRLHERSTFAFLRQVVRHVAAGRRSDRLRSAAAVA